MSNFIHSFFGSDFLLAIILRIVACRFLAIVRWSSFAQVPQDLPDGALGAEGQGGATCSDPHALRFPYHVHHFLHKCLRWVSERKSLLNLPSSLLYWAITLVVVAFVHYKLQYLIIFKNWFISQQNFALALIQTVVNPLFIPYCTYKMYSTLHLRLHTATKGITCTRELQIAPSLTFQCFPLKTHRSASGAEWGGRCGRTRHCCSRHLTHPWLTLRTSTTTWSMAPSGWERSGVPCRPLQRRELTFDCRTSSGNTPILSLPPLGPHVCVLSLPRMIRLSLDLDTIIGFLSKYPQSFSQCFKFTLIVRLELQLLLLWGTLFYYKLHTRHLHLVSTVYLL